MSIPTIPGVEFTDNTNQRTPCVLLLDASGSMAGEPMAQLNAGLEIFAQELKNDELAALRVQVTVISVGGYDDVQILQPWTDAVDLQPPVIQASGMTPLGKGMDVALENKGGQMTMVLGSVALTV